MPTTPAYLLGGTRANTAPIQQVRHSDLLAFRGKVLSDVRGQKPRLLI
jgi:hypothetical protein